jgi:hypothetical protein
MISNPHFHHKSTTLRNEVESNYIEKADGTAKAQAKQLLDQFKRIKHILSSPSRSLSANNSF